MRLLLLFLALTLTSCSSKYVFEEPEENVKKELQLWQVLNYREPYSNAIHHEDDRYVYDVRIEKFMKDRFNSSNTFTASTCPVGTAEYTVTDKETKQVVRHETHDQSNCAACHRR